MRASDFFLFPLTFLVSGLLAGWLWHVSRQLGRLPGRRPGQTRDGEFDRLNDRLTSAVRRIDVLERRNEELLRELGHQGGAGALPVRTSPGTATGDPSCPDTEAAARDGAGGPAPEVSESQWRSAMDRLGPAWRSRLASDDPGGRVPSIAGRDATGRRTPQPRPRSSRRGGPLDELFFPAGPPGGMTGHREADRSGTDRDAPTAGTSPAGRSDPDAGPP